ALATALRATLRLGSVRLRVAADDAGGDGEHLGTTDVVVGDPRGTTTAFAVDGDPGVVLEVTGEVDGVPVGRRTTEAIADLGPVIGVVVRLAEASTALAEARRTAAEAQHAERRALRRELHDV
uniref:hypothetical protein n=1 Tax=Microbacterium sp. K41 TaxID=2305437 RepID=UPI001443969B